MDKDIQIAFIVSIAPTLMAFVTLIVGLRNSKKLTQVHKDTNSNLKQANKKIEELQKLLKK
jgi:hypothetical protein